MPFIVRKDMIEGSITNSLQELQNLDDTRFLFHVYVLYLPFHTLSLFLSSILLFSKLRKDKKS